jgi:hypothetical protein
MPLAADRHADEGGYVVQEVTVRQGVPACCRIHLDSIQNFDPQGGFAQLTKGTHPNQRLLYFSYDDVQEASNSIRVLNWYSQNTLVNVGDFVINLATEPDHPCQGQQCHTPHAVPGPQCGSNDINDCDWPSDAAASETPPELVQAAPSSGGDPSGAPTPEDSIPEELLTRIAREAPRGHGWALGGVEHVPMERVKGCRRAERRLNYTYPTGHIAFYFQMLVDYCYKHRRIVGTPGVTMSGHVYRWASPLWEYQGIIGETSYIYPYYGGNAVYNFRQGKFKYLKFLITKTPQLIIRVHGDGTWVWWHRG